MNLIEPVSRPVEVFVAPNGNAFMHDIAVWIAEAATLLGRRSKVVQDRLPADDGSVNLVVAPHEFFVLRDDSDAETHAAARHSIPICTEQPGTPWFHLGAQFCWSSPLVVDINEVGRAAFADLGLPTERLRLGAVPSMVHVAGPASCATETAAEPERDIDVLFLGGNTERRAEILASLAPHLWGRRAEIRTFTFSRPLSGAEPGVVFGDDKYELLSRSKILVNLHRSDDSAGYFEWARMVETMANGCVVLTEPSVDHEPLVDGQHFVSGSPAELGSVMLDLLGDDERRARLAADARTAVLSDHPLTASLGPLLETIDRRLDESTGAGTGSARRGGVQHLGRLRRDKAIVRSHRPPLFGEFQPHAARRKAVYDQLLAEMWHRRAIDGVRCLVRHGTDDHVSISDTPAWTSATAEVSVIVTLYDYAPVITECLDSIVASADVPLEIVVVDDHSTDDGRAVVRRFLDANPSVPIRLVGSDVNRGLPTSRNLAVTHTRADKIMVMDADNAVYPSCLRKLADALDADPGATFAYATLETFGAVAGLASERGWFVPWLCDANYIDAQAMIRRTTLERYDGYRVDDGIHGWEDWDLWLRIAAAGEYGIHVPQMLGRYRTQQSSMISITNLVADELRAGLVRNYPNLPWPETPEVS